LYDRTKWQVILSLIQECGWIFAFEGIAIVCDRPSKISLEINNYLDAEGKSAIQFTDGYGIPIGRSRHPKHLYFYSLGY
jgi:hypothetical protein